ncbi:MAG: SUMF1/EgtB/PvdO family nonheme iron enzyme [Alphaproteobacteria bacterium]|nr:SUMF1/EgtB/PvdO family nonheme iron enzyme [Alphaproteobacteria bacterium]
MSPEDKQRALEDLLFQSLGDGKCREFVSGYFSPDVRIDMPRGPASDRDVIAWLCGLIGQAQHPERPTENRLITQEFFKALLPYAAKHRERIDAVAAHWEIKLPEPEPEDDPAGHALRRWLAWRIEALNELPGLLDPRGTARTLSTLYVQLLNQPVDGPDEAIPRALPLSKLLDRNPSGRFTVQGDPGSGKSTQLQHMARQRARQALAALEAGAEPKPSSLPILLPLPSLIRQGLSPLDAAAQRFRQAGQISGLWGDPEAAALTEALRARVETGQVCFLLDGLDEVAPQRVPEALKRARDWSAAYPRCALVLTSRRFGYQRPSDLFSELELRPLGEQEQRKLLTRIIRDDARVEEVMQLDGAPESLRRMMGNPFVLSLLGVIARDPEAELPNRRLALYRMAIPRFIRGVMRDPNHTAARLLDEHGDPPDAEKVQAAFSEMAFELLQVDSGPWTTHQISDALRKSKPGRWLLGFAASPEELPPLIAADTGLICPEDSSGPRGRTDTWRFLHRSFMECLAAQALHHRGLPEVKRFTRRISGRRHLLEPSTWWGPLRDQTGRWAEVFVMLAGLRPDGVEPMDFIRQLRGLHEGLFVVALAEVEDLPVDALAAELGGGQGFDLALIRELIGRVNDREALARLFLSVARRSPDSAELLQLLGAALVATGVEEKWLDELRLIAGGGYALGIPAGFWVPIEPGTFQMGSPDDDEMARDNEKPQHPVQISQGFELMRTPVTQALYAVVVGENPSDDLGDLRRPVDSAGWSDAQAFCTQLGRLSGRRVRLPTEAEWEYAARAGEPARFWWGDDPSEAAAHTWFEGNSDGRTHPVGAEGHTNHWGLSDMSGNVWEWVSDWWQDSYKVGILANSFVQTGSLLPMVKDPQGPKDGVYRVLRGGSFLSAPWYLRSAYRSWSSPGLRYWSNGFRCALGPGPQR